MRGMLFPVLGAALAAGAAGGQPLCPVEQLARVGGEFGAVSGEGGLAVVHAGERLLVMDVSDPGRPTPIGEAPLPGGAWTHRIAGRHALVVTRDEMRIFDLTNPAAPTQVGAVRPLPGSAIFDRPAVDGATAYLLCGGSEATVVSVDISNPARPAVLGSVASPAANWLAYITVAGGVVAVSLPQPSGGVLWFIDAREPANLRSAAAVPTVYSGDLVSRGRHTYAFNRSHIDIYDSADPYRPVLAGRVTPWAWFTGELELAGDRLYATIGHDPGGGSILAYDVSAPTQPVSLGSIRTSDMAGSLACGGERALVLFDAALHVAGGGGGGPIGVLGSLASEGAARSAAISGGRLCVGSTSGLHVYDVRDPRRPVRTGQALGYSRSAGSAVVAMNGDLAYVWWSSMLHVFDVSSGEPVLLSKTSIPCAGRMDADGPVAIIGCASGNTSVVVADLADPRSPRLSPPMVFPQSPRAVAIADGVALVSAEALHVLDVRNPTAPALLATAPIQALDLELRDGLAYACTAFGEVRVFDLRRPAEPVPLGQVPRQGGGPNGAVVQGTRLYTALHASPAGLTIHDVGDPARPRFLAAFDAPYQARAVAADAEGLIALARGPYGVSLLRACAPCPPDCDESTGPGALDAFDFLCFLNRFEAGYPYACNCDTSTGPGVCDAFDLACFQRAFEIGCP